MTASETESETENELRDVEWVTTKEAAEISGYSVRYILNLLNSGRVLGRKWVNAWMIDRDDLLAYKQEMDDLGAAKHDPTRTSERE
jgi:L-rhamnose isomerase